MEEEEEKEEKEEEEVKEKTCIRVTWHLLPRMVIMSNPGNRNYLYSVTPRSLSRRAGGKKML